ncbi:MAG: hypothetical protein ACI9GW_001046 [Halieaceae bacterium]|jgi:hypothetical protein
MDTHHVTIEHSDPEHELSRYYEHGECFVCVTFPHERSWLPGEPTSYSAIYYLHGSILRFLVAETELVLSALVQMEREIETDILHGEAALDSLAALVGCAVINPALPLTLLTLAIAKPWGQEVWYTGIEERGVCSIGDARSDTPLDVALSCAPHLLLGEAPRTPILLKILDPHPEPELGNLYFELHEEKQEVYIVTHVDEDAWPDGKGAIRLGAAPAVLDEFDNENDFKVAYLQAIGRYEKIRRDIDASLDELRLEQGDEPGATLSPERSRALLMRVSPDSHELERTSRTDMDRFTQLHPLVVGDVVKVPCYVPHALQHGVRTVEFQTPVYERMIISFNQKVLTQNHWDTEAAVAAMILSTEPLASSSDCLIDEAGLTVERIVDFDDFEVLRVRLEANSSFCVDSTDCYRLIMAVGGSLEIDGVHLASESAVLLPASYPQGLVLRPRTTGAVALLAQPKRQ